MNSFNASSSNINLNPNNQNNSMMDINNLNNNNNNLNNNNNPEKNGDNHSNHPEAFNEDANEALNGFENKDEVSKYENFEDKKNFPMKKRTIFGVIRKKEVSSDKKVTENKNGKKVIIK